MRRNLSNIAAGDFGAVILTDISRQTVTRYELVAAASRICSSRHWYCEQGSRLAELLTNHPGDAIPVVCHSIRSDATNSTVWQNSKLHGTQISSTYTFSYDVVDTCSDFARVSVSRAAFADLQMVRSGPQRLANVGWTWVDLMSVWFLVSRGRARER